MYFHNLNRLLNEYRDSLLDYVSPQLRKPKENVTRDMLTLAYSEKSILDKILLQRYSNNEYMHEFIDSLIANGHTNYEKQPFGKFVLTDSNGSKFILKSKIETDYYLLVLKYLPQLNLMLQESQNKDSN